MLKCLVIFVLARGVFTVSPLCYINTQSTSSQVEVKPMSHWDVTKALFLITTPYFFCASCLIKSLIGCEILCYCYVITIFYILS